jgi:hypothetical protein
VEGVLHLFEVELALDWRSSWSDPFQFWKRMQEQVLEA